MPKSIPRKKKPQTKRKLQQSMSNTTQAEINDAVDLMFKWCELNKQKQKGKTMQNATTKDIESKIAELISENIMFSNYDVTKSLRNKDFHVMHDDVKLVVGSYQFPYNYTKKNTRVKGHPAIIHCPDHLDVQHYNPDAIPEPIIKVALRKVVLGQTSANTASIPTQKPQNTKITVNTSGTTGLTFDARGRANIPASMVKAAGFSIGEKVACVIISDTIYIRDANIAIVFQGAVRKSYTVDHHNALRISGIDCKTANLLGKDVKITSTPRSIMISQK